MTSARCAKAASACSRRRGTRSEEHTSELQSQSNLVCRLLLEKKKNTGTSSRSMITETNTRSTSLTSGVPYYPLFLLTQDPDLRRHTMLAHNHALDIRHTHYP